MARRVVLRRQVPDDLKRIIQYFAGPSTDTALRFVDRYESALAEVRQHPGRGSIKNLPGVPGELRSWSIPGFEAYLILYRVHNEAVIVLAVSHGARDLTRLLRGRG